MISLLETAIAESLLVHDLLVYLLVYLHHNEEDHLEQEHCL